MIINFYSTLKKEEEKYKNPNGKKFLINHPFRGIICGKSGSGKTNCLMNLIHNLGCFDKFYLFVKLMDDDPLYNKVLIPKIRSLEEKNDSKILEIYSDSIDDLPKTNSLEIDSSKQNLFVFDDMLDESNKLMKKIMEYFTKMRKRNCSMVFISQDYFSIHVKIRRNCTFTIFTKIASLKDLNNIYQDLSKDDFENFSQFKEMFQNSTRNKYDTLIIDKANEEKKYRKNFLELQSYNR